MLLAFFAITVPLAFVVASAIVHAVSTRHVWRAGAEQRAARVAGLVGVAQAYNAVWGIDTIRAVRRIARLRGDVPRPRMSPHFVVAVTASGLWLVHGARGDQGLTVVWAEEFESLKTAAVGYSGTGWFISCSIEGQKVVLPIRLSHVSSDFLGADDKWAKTEGERVAATLLR